MLSWRFFARYVRVSLGGDEGDVYIFSKYAHTHTHTHMLRVRIHIHTCIHTQEQEQVICWIGCRKCWKCDEFRLSCLQGKQACV